MSVSYDKRFARILTEADVAPMDDQAAMASTLDKGTDPSDFNVDVPADGGAINSTHKEHHGKLQKWVELFDKFADYLNGTDSESIQSQLNSAHPDTLFDKISHSESKKIVKVAADLTALSEAFKGYLGSAKDPRFSESNS